MKPEPDLKLLQPDSRFYNERKHAALAGARRNALRRLIRCLFAENIIDRTLLLFAPQGQSAWLPLWQSHSILFFEKLWAAPAGTIINDGAVTLIDAGGARTAVETPDELIQLLRPHFDFAPSDEGVAGLKADMANSIDNDALARIYRAAWNAQLRSMVDAAGAPTFLDCLRKQGSVRDAALLLDQWGALEGHPFYPTWKSKPDLSPEEVAQLSPEFNARVRLRIAALRADMAHVERMPQVGAVGAWFAERFPAPWADWKAALNARQLDEKDWLPLPIHGWHLEHYVKREYAAEIDEGILILDGPDIDTLPTMSFRTMAPVSDAKAPFIKLPVALWLTSEQRSLQAKSIHMGPRISALIKRILADENHFGESLDIFPEEVGYHYRHAVRREDRPGRHLSVVYRSCSEAFERSEGLLPVTVAALFAASPVDGRPLVTELIERGRGRAQAADAVQTVHAVHVEAWFRQYAKTVIHPVVGIYLLYGIGLEAHQQNTTVMFDADGTAHSLLMRDFGDGRTFAPLLHARGHELKPYVHPGILPTVFSDDIEPVRAFVIDACFVCHLHELALLLTAEYGLAPTRLWEILRRETERSFEAYAPRLSAEFLETEKAAFLEQPWMTRSVLRMHLLRYADYRLQHALPNPLAAARREA